MYYKDRLKFFGIILGLDNIILVAPLLLFFKNSFVKLPFNKEIFFYIILYILFFLLYPLLYSRNFEGLYFLKFGLNYYFSILLIFLGGLVASILTLEKTRILIYNVSIGIVLKAIFLTLTSLLFYNESMYGNVYNFFTGNLDNSASYSNSLSYFAISFFLFLDKKTINSYILFLLTFFSGVLLAGRTFFIISALSFGYKCFKKEYSLNELRNFSLIVIIFYIFSKIINFRSAEITSRFLNEKLESPRFDLYHNYLMQFLDNPFTKIQPEYQIHIWFHNVLMDTHAAAGFFMMLYLLALFAYPILKSFFANKFLSHEIIAYFLCLLILFSSIPIEGGELYSFVFLLILSVILIKSSRNEKQ
jgi:hypothetical protein